LFLNFSYRNIIFNIRAINGSVELERRQKMIINIILFVTGTVVLAAISGDPNMIGLASALLVAASY
jgi:hypothetical protein